MLHERNEQTCAEKLADIPESFETDRLADDCVRQTDDSVRQTDDSGDRLTNDIFSVIHPEEQHLLVQTTCVLDAEDKETLSGEKKNTPETDVEKEFYERTDALDMDSDMDTGWSWVILFASFGTNAMTSVANNGSGILYLALKDIHEEGVAITAFAGILQTAITSIAAPLATLVTDRYSCRVAIMLAGLLYTSGNLLTAFAPNIETVIFTLGVLSGLGSALGYTACNVVISYNFKKKRNFALGLTATGGGVGLFVFAPLLQISRDYYGPMGMFIIFAAIVANMSVFGALCFPSKMEIHCKKERMQKAAVLKTSFKANNKKLTSLKLYLSVLFKKEMILLCLSAYSFYLAVYTAFLYLPAFVVSKGISELQASFILSLTGIVSIVGRLLTGIITNMNIADDIVFYAGSMAIISGANFLYACVNSYSFSHILFAVIVGLLFGTSFILSTGVSVQFVGVDFISAALGVQFFFGGVGALTGPIITGFMIDAGGSYEQVFFLTASFGAVAAVLSALTMCCRKREPLVNVMELHVT